VEEELSHAEPAAVSWRLSSQLLDCSRLARDVATVNTRSVVDSRVSIIDGTCGILVSTDTCRGVSCSQLEAASKIDWRCAVHKEHITGNGCVSRNQ